MFQHHSGLDQGDGFNQLLKHALMTGLRPAIRIVACRTCIGWEMANLNEAWRHVIHVERQERD